MTTRTRFGNVEAAVTVLLSTALGLPDGRTGTTTPAELRGLMPFVLAYRYGGSDDGITDTVELGVEVFAETYAVGEPLAERARQVLLGAPHVVALPDGGGTVVIGSLRTVEAPVEAPYGAGVRRFTARYQAKVRRT